MTPNGVIFLFLYLFSNIGRNSGGGKREGAGTPDKLT